MNPLTVYAFNHGFPLEVMNILQNHGIISDLCVSTDDVEAGDARRAVQWLEANDPKS